MHPKSRSCKNCTSWSWEDVENFPVGAWPVLPSDYSTQMTLAPRRGLICSGYSAAMGIELDFHLAEVGRVRTYRRTMEARK